MQDEIIYHHGIKGMKWGIRRYQNEDGSLTPAGKKRRSLGVAGELAVKGTAIESKARRHEKFANQLLKEIGDMRIRDSKEKTQQKQYVKLDSSYIESRKPSKKDLQKAYVNLDDTLNGAKYLNKKAAKYAEDALAEIDRQLSRNDGSYDAKKINDLIDKAMMAIDDELDKG